MSQWNPLDKKLTNKKKRVSTVHDTDAKEYTRKVVDQYNQIRELYEVNRKVSYRKRVYQMSSNENFE